MTMPDLHDRFRVLDKVTFPHTAPDFHAPRRVETPHSEAGVRTRVGVVVLALVSTAATIGLVAVAFRGGGSGEGGETSPAPIAPAATNGRLAFNCGDHICTRNPDGTDQIDLFAEYAPTDVVAGYYPRWSPDGTQIAFSGYDRRGSFSGGGANYDIFVMNADGSALRNVTTSADDVAAGASQGMPVWSPGGSMIAFEGDDGRTDGLFVMNADGSGLSRVGSFWSPAWSPDGSRILASGKGDDGPDLFSMAPDGSGVIQLTSGPGLARDLSWSPDGSRVAFVRSSEGEERVIVAQADGSGETAVFLGAAEPYWPPAWSPDGTRLAFEAGASGNSSVWVAQADGSGAMDLTPGNTREEHTPVWSPDGQRIAFEGSEVTGIDNTGTYRVYVVDADGSGERALTDDETSGFSLAWQPLPPTADPELAEYTNPMGIPITMRYPADWFAQSVSQTTVPDGTGGKQTGLVISNAPAAMPSADSSTPTPGPLPEDPRLPQDFVTATILSSEADLAPGPDSPLPLSMEGADVAPGPANIRFLEATVAGRAISISVQGGPEASRADLALADAIVASIRPSIDAPVETAVADLLSPAPRPSIPGVGEECFVGLVRANAVKGDGVLRVLGPYAPTWLPDGFGLLEGYDGTGINMGYGLGAFWTDAACHQVHLDILPDMAAEESPRLPGVWTLISDADCTYAPLFDVHCLGYHAQANGAVLNLTTVGLGDEDASRVVSGIHLTG
jgi:hypothetical protein